MPRSLVRSGPSRFYRPCARHRRGAVRRRLVETRLRFKRLSPNEVEAYLASGEWRGKAGGYAIQGLAGAFVERLVGSYSNVVGLPLAETAALLAGEGYHIHGLGCEPRSMTADDHKPCQADRRESKADLPDLRQAAQQAL